MIPHQCHKSLETHFIFWLWILQSRDLCFRKLQQSFL